MQLSKVSPVIPWTTTCVSTSCPLCECFESYWTFTCASEYGWRLLSVFRLHFQNKICRISVAVGRQRFFLASFFEESWCKLCDVASPAHRQFLQDRLDGNATTVLSGNIHAKVMDTWKYVTVISFGTDVSGFVRKREHKWAMTLLHVCMCRTPCYRGKTGAILNFKIDFFLCVWQRSS